MSSEESKVGLFARFAVLLLLLFVVPALCLMVLRPRKEMAADTPALPTSPAPAEQPVSANDSVPEPPTPVPLPELSSTAGPTRPPPAEPPLPPTTPEEGDETEPFRDLFSAFRCSAPYPADYWQSIDEALHRIKVLRGAYIDPSTKQLIIVGDYTEDVGPVGLQDLSAIFWGEFMGNYSERLGNKPGVTIDPAEGKGWETKPMKVYYGGDTEGTRLGKRMFECDWLLKGLGLGIDAIAPKSKRDQIPGFETHIARAVKARLPGSNVWTRFWIALTDENTGKGNGSIPLQIDPDGRAIWFPPGFQIYACTEIMIQEPNGEVRSSGGLQDKAAKQFVEHFNNNFESYARVFPVLNELRECAKLTVLAHWLRERRKEPEADKLAGRPADFQQDLMYLGFPQTEESTTPTEVPVQEGAHGPVALHGGVSMQSPSFSKPFDNSAATSLANRIRAVREKLPNYGSYVARNDVRRTEMLAIIGAPPTGPPPTARSEIRPKLVTRSISTGKITVSNKKPPAVTAPYDLAGVRNLRFPWLLTGPYTGQGIITGKIEVYEMPARRKIGEAGADAIPDQIEFTSATGDVRGVRFDPEMKIDSGRMEIYYDSTNTGIRYFPNDRRCETADGKTFRFSPTTGVLQRADTPDGKSFGFQFHRLEDGPLRVNSELSPQELARPPPEKTTEEFIRQPNPPRSKLPRRRVSSGSIEVSPPPDINPWVTVTNLKTGQSIDIVREAGEVVIHCQVP